MQMIILSLDMFVLQKISDVVWSLEYSHQVYCYI